MITEVELALARREYQKALLACERHIYELAYLDSKYNKTKAASLLGVSRGHFYLKLREYNLEGVI